MWSSVLLRHCGCTQDTETYHLHRQPQNPESLGEVPKHVYGSIKLDFLSSKQEAISHSMFDTQNKIIRDENYQYFLERRSLYNASLLVRAFSIVQ